MRENLADYGEKKENQRRDDKGEKEIKSERIFLSRFWRRGSRGGAMGGGREGRGGGGRREV